MNIYWPVYKNLEAEFLKIMYYVHIDDEQLDVYSSKIADLILRAAIEIESICKELYVANGGISKKNIKFDHHILDEMLIPNWVLDKKVVIITAYNCFRTQRELYPFVKGESRTSASSCQTFSWNNAYQNLKHDRGKSLPLSSIRHLFDVMAALYVLNIYYKSEVFPPAKFHGEVPIPPALGSDIFSIHIHHLNRSWGAVSKPIIDDSFLKSVYYTDITKEAAEKFNKSVMRYIATTMKCALKTAEGKMAFKKSSHSKDPIAFQRELGMPLWNKALQEANRISQPAFFDQQFEAHLNKNQPKKCTYTLGEKEVQEITQALRVASAQDATPLVNL